MRLVSLTVAGIRGFNEKQTVDLGGPLVIYWGPNGCGKTSIGEGIEWLLYGRTLKRVKGDEISKREYQGSYQNTHFRGPGRPFAELHITDGDGKARVIRRELHDDETSSLVVDGQPVADLKQFGVGALYDRPLILQHTLQEFIFMKPKMRYEVLSAMLGLEPLIDFRNAVEAAKTEFANNLPARAKEAQARAALLLGAFRRNALLNPVANAVQQGKLDDAHKHLVQVALGRVPPGTAEQDILPALRQVKASKERAKLDWGRFSLSLVPEPGKHPSVTGLTSLEQRLAEFERQIHEAVKELATAARRDQVSSVVRQFYELGLQLLDSDHPERCPFCLKDTLTPQRLAEIRRASEIAPPARITLSKASGTLSKLETEMTAHRQKSAALLPALPGEEEKKTIKELGGLAAKERDSYLASCEAAEAVRGELEKKSRTLGEAIKAAQSALEEGKTAEEQVPTVRAALLGYSDAVRALPDTANGYAAIYAALDPIIRGKLASEEDVVFLASLISGLERWHDTEIAREAERTQDDLQELIRLTRQFIETKQKQILGQRDREIKGWYQLLSGSADVCYDGIAPATDNLELKAKTYAKPMMAAPNLSQSQLNCIGLAVYLATCTRKGSPFRLVLFDDPIQSMDDEHTESFKNQVVRKLLDQGFQVVVLTHMQTVASGIEQLYRRDGAVYYQMEGYIQSGPSIVWKGPEIQKLLNEVRKNKDSPNDGYRKQAVQGLRQFVERFVKDFYTADTGNPVSKKYENESWPRLRNLLRQCPKFDSKDEPVLEGTHNFTSQHLHADDTVPQSVPPGTHIHSHYISMQELLEKYSRILSLQCAG